MGVQDISIELERNNGIFYAGEVVRGTVTLRTDSEVNCRGFHLRFEGKARVHWHTGSGDNRTDYDGSTYFVSQRHTLFGNFYRTGVLDNAGSDAVFGKVHGDGVMYIPIDKHEENRLEMIVRVMDYDWGKRDDLLGEIVVDVASLAQSKTMMQYDLTRFGKQEKGSITMSAKIIPMHVMFPSSPGDPMGEKLCLVLTVHEAVGLRKADWVGKNDVYVQAYRFPPGTTERRFRNQLPRPEKNAILSSGVSTFGFAFQLPSTAPGSAELLVYDLAHIRYQLYAYVDLAMWRDPSRRITVTVIPNRPVPKLSLLAGARCTLRDEVLHGCVYCCMKCCKANGLVSIDLKTDRRSYAPGETIDTSDSYVQNNSSADLEMKISIVQLVIMKTAFGSSCDRQKKFNLTTVALPRFSKLPLSQYQSFLKIPAIFPSFNGGVSELPTRQRYPCLEWSYVLEVKVAFPKSCASSAHAAIPMLISCAPPYPSAIQEASNLQTAVFEPYQARAQALSIFEEAISGPEPSQTTPHITGAEDGGNTIPASEMEYGVNTFVVGEDAGTVGSGNSSYTPVVNFFDPSKAPSTEADIVIDTVSQSILPSSDLSVVKSILSAMDKTYDKRYAVGQWVREHPGEAASLSPSDIGQVLKEGVSFSLDQPAVAAELAAGFERSGSLTCRHVVEAMRASEYQKTDVAKSMIPFVSDPINKEIVLKEIEFEFEKQTVAAYFRN